MELMMDQETYEEKMRLVCMIDKDSPRTRATMLKLGVDNNTEFKVKTFKDFKQIGLTPEI